jgi:pentatricopeptide repeat protein
MREKLKEQYEKEFAQGTVDKTRVKAAMHGQMDEALYVWFRQMQARDMALTDESHASGPSWESHAAGPTI